MVVINVIAAVVGIMAAGACAAVVRRAQLQLIAGSKGSCSGRGDGDGAPATPTSQTEQGIRSAGQTSPQSMALRNAMNNTSVEPVYSPFGADPEPFWQDTPQEAAPAPPARSPRPAAAGQERMVTLDGELVMDSVEEGPLPQIQLTWGVP
eukprot:s404_g26.t1